MSNKRDPVLCFEHGPSGSSCLWVQAASLRLFLQTTTSVLSLSPNARKNLLTIEGAQENCTPKTREHPNQICACHIVEWLCRVDRHFWALCTPLCRSIRGRSVVVEQGALLAAVVVLGHVREGSGVPRIHGKLGHDFGKERRLWGVKYGWDEFDGNEIRPQPAGLTNTERVFSVACRKRVQFCPSLRSASANNGTGIPTAIIYYNRLPVFLRFGFPTSSINAQCQNEVLLARCARRSERGH